MHVTQVGHQPMLLDDRKGCGVVDLKVFDAVKIKLESNEPACTELSRTPTIQNVNPSDSENEEDPNDWNPVNEAAKPVDVVKEVSEPPIQSSVDTFISSLEHRSSKRKRVEVLLYHLSDIKKKWKEEEEVKHQEKLEDVRRLEAMRDPRVKTVRGMEFSFNTVQGRLKPIGFELFNITLNKVDQETTVSRKFMSSEYGGSPQEISPKIAAKFLAKHGLNDFAYLNISYQPMAPQVPGAPGLFFCCEKAISPWVGLRRVLTRIQPNEWKYMGQYEVKPSHLPVLTKEEWASQKLTVRKTWAREICRQAWGSEVRARIRARVVYERLRPTAAQIEQMEVSELYKETTSEEVERAYDKGEETLGVWTMKCRGYDNAFQLQLCEKFPPWAVKDKIETAEKKRLAKIKKEEEMKMKREEGIKKEDGVKEEDTKPQKTRVVPNRKRKRSESQPSDSEDEKQWPKVEDALLSDHKPELNYIPRGTRSRPIIL